MIKLFTESDFENARSRDLLPLRCEYCNAIFHSSKGQIQAAIKGVGKNKLKLCSVECRATSSLVQIEVDCKHCGFTFFRLPSQIRGNTFCSWSCAGKYNNANKTKGFRRSKLEDWVEKELGLKFPSLDILFNDRKCIGLELDIYIPSLKLAFEFNGIIHYEPIYGDKKLRLIRSSDARKFVLCDTQGIDLIVIDTSLDKRFTRLKATQYLDFIVETVKMVVSWVGVEPTKPVRAARLQPACIANCYQPIKRVVLTCLHLASLAGYVCLGSIPVGLPSCDGDS